MNVTAERLGSSHYLAQTSVILARHRPAEKLSLELSASTCLVQKNNLVAVLAISVVEFSHGLAAPFMWLSAGKPQRNNERLGGKRERGWQASLNAIESGLRTCSELGSERYKKPRSERSELGSERYKKAA